MVSLYGSATLRAKKEYRQKNEQRTAGRKPRPPPSRSAPLAPATPTFSPAEIIEDNEQEGYVP